MAVDMLVALEGLDDPRKRVLRLSKRGIEIRRALPKEADTLTRWVKENFSEAWASECRIGLTRTPPSCFVARGSGVFVGFACFDVSYKGSFGPIGVLQSYRKMGIGSTLLLLALNALREMGYKYGIITDVGPTEFYQKAVSAIVIPVFKTSRQK